MYTTVETVQRIKNLAREKGVKTTEMLSACELSKNALSSMSGRGSWIQANSLAKIADYLECSVDYLLGRTEEPTANTGIQQNITAGGNNNGSNNISITPAVEAGQEIDSILSRLKPRERTELMMMIYHFADEHMA